MSDIPLARVRRDGIALPLHTQCVTGRTTVSYWSSTPWMKNAVLGVDLVESRRTTGERVEHDRVAGEAEPVGVAQDLLGVGVQVLDRLAAVLAVGVVVVHVGGHRARAVERDERGDVLEARWAPASA